MILVLNNLASFRIQSIFREFEWYVMNSVFLWKRTFESVFMAAVARQGFVTSTIWHEICSWKHQPIFPLVTSHLSLLTKKCDASHLSHFWEEWRVPGLGKITWWNVMIKKMRGDAGKKLYKNREIFENGSTCGCTGTVDLGPKTNAPKMSLLSRLLHSLLATIGCDG